MLMQRSLDYLKRYFHDNFAAWKDDAAVFAPPKFERVTASASSTSRG